MLFIPWRVAAERRAGFWPTAPPISFWCYRVVAGAAADRLIAPGWRWPSDALFTLENRERIESASERGPGRQRLCREPGAPDGRRTGHHPIARTASAKFRIRASSPDVIVAGPELPLRRLGAPWHSPLRPWWGSIRFMSPTAKRPCLRHRIPKMIRSGREREQRTLPVFLPVSSLLFAFAEIS